MSRSKQNRTQQPGLGKERKETREERRARKNSEAEAKETCLKILPYAAITIFVTIVAFALWVHSVPPKQVKVISSNPQQDQQAAAAAAQQAAAQFAAQGLGDEGMNFPPPPPPQLDPNNNINTIIEEVVDVEPGITPPDTIEL